MTDATAEESRLAAARVSGKLRLADLRLRKLDAELFQPRPDPPLTLDLQVSPSFTRTDDLVVYNIEYEATGTTTEGERAFNASIVLSLFYDVLPQQEVDNADLGAFGLVSVLLSAHPYLRELLQTLTARMGLPALVLDLMQSPVDLTVPATD